jgi:hypothetical protein
MKPTAPLRCTSTEFATTTLDVISVPGFPSATRVFALAHSRRIAFQRYPWLISFSLGLDAASR